MKAPLKQLPAGKTVVDFFVVRKVELRHTCDGDAEYLHLELGNREGRIFGTLWDEPQSGAKALKVGDIVKVQARVSLYNNRPSLMIERYRKARPEDNVSLDQFLPPPNKSVADLEKQFFGYVDSVETASLRGLLQDVFCREFFLAFSKAPGGRLWHHARLGGLIEHTVSVAAICEQLAGHFSAVQRDLLIAGALLHDVGKVEAYRFDRGFFEYTDSGRLIGHIALGMERVQHYLRGREEIPEAVQQQLAHLILSHHGELSRGSPVVPMTLEAFLLHYADQLDAMVDAYLRIAAAEGAPEKRWSQYVRLLDRYFYFPPGLLEEDEEIT